MAENDRQRFSGLELLPTPTLEKIIEQDFNQEADLDPELIDYILEVMAKRAKIDEPHTFPNMHTAWNKLQQRLNSEETFGQLPTFPAPAEKSKTTSRKKHILRYIAAVAACVALIFGAMITAQAMGVDVFGAIAKWTDSIFYFEVEPRENRIDPKHKSLCEQSLADAGIPNTFAPASVPVDYILSNVEVVNTSIYSSVLSSYSHPTREQLLTIEICKYTSNHFIPQTLYEKSQGEPISYTHNGKVFYLFKNDNSWTAAWMGELYDITIAGASSKEDAIFIIQSIKE